MNPSSPNLRQSQSSTPIDTEEWKVEIPPFTIGRLRAEKLKYNSEKAGSDFFQRYKDEVMGSHAIEREPLRTKTFDFPRIREELFEGVVDFDENELSKTHAANSLITWYFSLLNLVLFEHFVDELVSAQSVFVALGAPFLDPRSLQMLSSVIKTHRVAVFLNMGAQRRGFVAPTGTGPILIDFANMHERVPRVLKELRDDYGIDRFGDSPLHRTTKLFADFIARARRNEIDDHVDEALLHYVIALELIFGERNAIQKRVSERVAVITFRENEVSFEKQRQFIDNVYDLRSRYVHAGERITDVDAVEKLRLVCGQAIRCLLRFQSSLRGIDCRGSREFDHWLRELDYLAAAFVAGKEPDEKHLKDAFILF